MTLAVALPSWVGDAVMATPALRALRTAFPDERLVAVARPPVRTVLDPNPWTDAFVEVERSVRGTLRAARALRKEGVSTGVLLPNSARTALLFRMARVERRVGYDRDGRGWLLTDRIPPERAADGGFIPLPQIDYYLRLAAHVGAPADDKRMALFPTEADDAAAAAAFRAADVAPETALILAPGASFGPSKQWPVQHWGRLAQLARERFGLTGAVVCGPSDAATAKAIVASAQGACVTLHDKNIDLASARAAVRDARAMVAIDSGLRHYAAALDRPVVALFGPTDIRWTETWHAREVRLQQDLPCGPCQQPVCPRGGAECMWKIAPEAAADALGEALRRGANAAEAGP